MAYRRKTGRQGSKGMRRMVNSFGSFRLGDLSLRNKAHGDNYTLETVEVGGKNLYRHKDGYVLASRKYIKAVPHDLRVMLMADCHEVSIRKSCQFSLRFCKAISMRKLVEVSEGETSAEEVIPVTTATLKKKSEFVKASRRSTGYFSELSAGSSRFSRKSSSYKMTLPRSSKHMLQARLKEKGLATISVDNSQLILSCSTTNKKKDDDAVSMKCFNWSQIYALEVERGSPAFNLIFYAPLEHEIEQMRTKGHFDSDLFQFVKLRITAESSDDAAMLIQNIYSAIQSQAVMAGATASRLEEKKSPKAEDQFRLAVDLWMLMKLDDHVLKAQQALGAYLQEYVEDSEKEAEFWKNLSSDSKSAIGTESML